MKMEQAECFETSAYKTYTPGIYAEESIQYASIDSLLHSNVAALKINPSNAELNPICRFLTLLGSHHIHHVSRIRVNAE